MGPTWVLSTPGGPHVGPMNLAIMVGVRSWRHAAAQVCRNMHSMHRSKSRGQFYHPILKSTVCNYPAKEHARISSHINVLLPINHPGIQIINVTKIDWRRSAQKCKTRFFSCLQLSMITSIVKYDNYYKCDNYHETKFTDDYETLSLAIFYQKLYAANDTFNVKVDVL